MGWGDANNHLQLNLTVAAIPVNINQTESVNVLPNTSAVWNASTNQYIMYGWANSYYDEANTLIGNYEIGVYQGTGVSCNKVTTKGKPAWVMIKRLDSTGKWVIKDNLRGLNQVLTSESSAAEYSNASSFSIVSDGFVVNYLGAFQDDINVASAQYLYMVVYDNDSGSGRSKYPKATDTTNLSINALVPYANGIDAKGSKVSIAYKNETISGVTLTQGKNYVYSKNDGTYGVSNVDIKYGTNFSIATTGSMPRGHEFDLNTNLCTKVTSTYDCVIDFENQSLVNIFGDNSCKVLYRFEDNISDTSGSFDFTARGTPSYIAGVYGKGISLPSGVSLYNASSVFTNTHTFSALVKIKSDVTSGMIWSVGADNGANCIFLYTNANGKYNISQGSNVGGTGVSSSSLKLNKWVYLTAIITPDNYKLYADGELVINYNPTSNVGTLASGFGVGALSSGTYTALDAEFDQVRVFNKALSESEALSLFPKYIYTYSTEAVNYLDCIVYADQNGQVEYVEQLPKIEYKDIVKANEFKGKNANKVAIAFDGTTTPVAIIGDMLGFATVIRTATGVFDIYPSEDVDIRGLKFSGMTNAPKIQLYGSPAVTTNKITVITSNSAGTAVNAGYISIVGVGE